MREIVENKYNRLKDIIRDYSSVVIGLSGGIDSSLLAKVSYDVLSDKVLCVIGLSSSYPRREELSCIEIAKSIGVSYITVETDELGIESYRENGGDRCYFCKKELYTRLIAIKEERAFSYILDGTNLSDLAYDDRPGLRAIKELGIKTPLVDAEFYKSELRELARVLGLPNWDKPSFACLSSRVPEGTKISADILHKIELGEDILYSFGFRQFRLRYHKEIARLQLLEKDFAILTNSDARKDIIDALKGLGFSYVTLDLVSYKEYL